MKLSELVQPLNAKLLGTDGEFVSVSTDTRTIQTGDLFVALKGEQFDGHHYVEQAFANGAVAALVSTAQTTKQTQLLVADTLQGLGKLAQTWAAQFQPKKIAITGSCGKTTLKEMVAAILSEVGPTLATKGNLNNEIGVPLTLLKLQQKHQFAVVECGANHVGEIGYTSALVGPDVAVVNIVAPAHLEGFGSIENVAKAKGEIYDSLTQDGVAVINLDDQFAGQYLAQTAGKRQLTFSLRNKSADVYAESIQLLATGQYQIEVHSPAGIIAVMLPLLGQHNVSNALAACAIVLALNVPVNAIQQGLQKVMPARGRLFPVTDIAGFHLIDDSYNANPASIQAAIDVLADSGQETCLVLGGMAELGEHSADLHLKIGAYAAKRGIGAVYSLGPNARFYKEGYEASKPDNGRFIICDDHRAIATALAQAEKNKLILIKGSRSAAMERVIDALRNLTSDKEEQH